MSQDLITRIYNSFHPYQPLPFGHPAYVYCSEVRGNDNICIELGNKIKRSDPSTYQLYTGHRGGGKTTELYRLQKYLDENGCFVVFFGATDGDIDEIDAEYTDILLACTRHILESLKNYANPNPVLNWLKSRWESLKDLALSEVEFDNLQLEAKIGLFAKLTAKLRQIPSTRSKIRNQVDLHSISLIDGLNEFIAEAKQNLPDQKTKLVVIADNLDRIVPVSRDTGRTNHDEIFLDYSTQLTRLNCHIIYTVPISLVYSNRATQLRNLYDTPQVLPMIMIRDKGNNLYQAGMDKLKEIIEKRVHIHDPKIDIDTQIFANEEQRKHLCRMTGGHVRELMLFMQTAMDYIDQFPLTETAINHAINEARENTYRSAVDNKEWEQLAHVYLTKNLPNEDEYRSLLFRRCVLEYRAPNQKGDMIRWHDIHPLIEEIEEFQAALTRVKP